MAFRRILVVDDEEPMRHILSHLLTAAGYDVRAAPSAHSALSEIDASEPDLVLTDVRMPGMTGIELLARIRQRYPDIMVIVMSAYGTLETAIEAVKAGAYDYISKPFRPDEVVLVLRKAEERERLVRENRRLREAQKNASLSGMIGESPAFHASLKMIRRIAEVKSTALLIGESGTGKELFARAIHDLSPRHEMPFLAVNCGAIPEQLIESELFGHMRGAFTDATATRKGLFEEADGGTLFLDEIGELPLNVQVKLLRVLQEEEIRRVGDARSIKVNVRIVAATLRDLPAEVKNGRFREDLFYRLNVVQVRLPPLRERAGDVALLVNAFVDYYNKRFGLNVKGFTSDAMALMDGYHWPGNVRELENTVERAMVLAEDSLIGPEGLPDRFLAPTPAERVAAAPAPPEGDLSIKKANRLLEEDYIRRALVRTKGNRTRAAELLELSHRALLYKLKEFGIT